MKEKQPRQQPDGVRETLTKEELLANLRILYGKELGDELFRETQEIWRDYKELPFGGGK